MSAVMSPSLSSFSTSSSPPPSPHRIQASQQQSPQLTRSSSNRSRNGTSSSPSTSAMGPPPAVPGAATSPGTNAPATAVSSLTSPRLKRPLSAESLNSAGTGSSSQLGDHRSSPRPKRQGQVSVASSPHIRQSPLARRAVESEEPRRTTPQNQPQTRAPEETMTTAQPTVEPTSQAATQPDPNPNETSLDELNIGSSKKLVPRGFHLCSLNDLVVLISDMLNQLVSLNDGIPLTQGGLTRFHSRAPPTISIADYLHRIAVYTTLEPSTLLSMVYYIDLLSNHYPAFTISSLTVHRFLITAATVSSKGLCDSFCTNTFYAKVGGISLRELNVLELEFLSRVDWRIVPQPEVLGEYYASLVRRMGDTWGFEEGPGSDGSSLEDLMDEAGGSNVSGGNSSAEDVRDVQASSSSQVHNVVEGQLISASTEDAAGERAPSAP